jgi:acyl-CoA dehydrogenase
MTTDEMFEFDLPDAVRTSVRNLEHFVETEIRPLETEGDNARFFDHRREWARTDFENGGVPSAPWRDLLAEMHRRADAAGWLRLMLPSDVGGKDASQLLLAAIREKLAIIGVGLHNPLDKEISVVANNPLALLIHKYGSADQREEFLEPAVSMDLPLAFALTEPGVGSDATRLQTEARRVGGQWSITGKKKWISFMDGPDVLIIVFARTSGEPGTANGITAFLVPRTAPGVTIDRFTWTMNLPTDHAEITLDQVEVPDSAVLGPVDQALEMVQLFVHRNRMRQAAASLGAARFCIERSVTYANQRSTWGTPLSRNQAIQFPLVELHSEATMLRWLVRTTARGLDGEPLGDNLSELVAMSNYRANRLACDAADQAIQVHGANGYSRDEPLELIYRHHRRYRITEGAEEIQIRRVAQGLFGLKSLAVRIK